jgi:hypothetical protein
MLDIVIHYSYVWNLSQEKLKGCPVSELLQYWIQTTLLSNEELQSDLPLEEESQKNAEGQFKSLVFPQQD